MAKVESYLRAASGDEDDRGWSLLLSDDRVARFGDRVAYVTLAEASDWDAFSWEVIDAQCDDGACAVWLSVPSAEAIPQVLAEGALEWRESGVPSGANASVSVLQRGLFGDGISLVQG